MSEDPFASVPGHASRFGTLRPVDAKPPTEQDRYTRDALLAEGGMGRVFLAHDARLEREIAIKEALPGPAVSALAREARLTARLDHPSIVAVHDFGYGPSGLPFYAMRLVRGRSLEQVLSDPLTRAQRLALLTHFRDACQALAYAHAMGIVHRDIKPANVLVGAFGETQVVDWGLALPVTDARAELIGSPAWMSPEQANERPADARTDVFGLGAILYHTLSGQPPYPQPDPLAAIVAAGEGDHPALPSDLPPDLVAIARKAMRVDPDARYPDAGALADDIERYLTGERVSAYDYAPAELFARLLTAWRAPIIVAAVLLTLLTTYIAVSTIQLSLERDRAVGAEARANDALATSLASQATTAISTGAEGSALVFAANSLLHRETPLARGAYVAARSAWPLARLSRQSLHDCPNATLIADGLLCHDSDALWRLTQGREVWRRAMRALTVSPSARFVAVQDGESAHLLDLTTGAVVDRWIRLAGAIPLVGNENDRFTNRRHENPNWVGDPHPERRVTIEHCAVDLPPRVRTMAPRSDTVADWCADGVIKVGDPTTHRSYPTNLSVREHGDASVMTFNRDETRLVVGYYRGLMLMVDLTTGAIRPFLRRDASGVVSASFSPSGARLATVRESGHVDIWDVADLSLLASVPTVHARDVAMTDDNTLRVLGRDHDVWALTEQPYVPVRARSRGVRTLQLSQSGAWLASGHSDADAYVWPVQTPAEPDALSFGLGTVMQLAWTDDDHLLGVGGETHIGHHLHRTGASGRPVSFIGRSRDLVYTDEGTFVALHYAAPPLRLDLNGEPQPLDCPKVEFRQAVSGYLVTIAGDVHPYLPGRCGEPLANLSAQRLGRAAEDLLALSFDSVVRIAPNGAHKLRFNIDNSQAYSLRGSPNGQWIAAGGLDHAIRVFDGDTGALVAQWTGHTQRVSALTFTADSQYLISAGWDGVIRTWPLDALTITPNDLGVSLDDLL